MRNPTAYCFRRIPHLALAVLVAGCSSNEEKVSGPGELPLPLTSGSVVVDRTAVLLTGVGQSRQLTARTTNDGGTPVNAAVVWRSSAPDQVSVDATGRVVAKTIGSAQIFAESGSFRSAPVFVVVAEPKPAALLVNDAQVLAVGPPIGLAPGEIPGVGTRYEVRLTGIPISPSPGTVVLAAENAPVAGKVVSARNESGATVITLAMAPLGELLARYSIDWSIDLSAFPAVVAQPGMNSAALNAAPAIRFDPQAIGGAADIIQPFTALNCEASLGPVLADRKIQLAPTADFRLDFIETPGHTRRALVGSEKLVGSVSLKLNAGFKFKGSCLAQVLIRIPIGGLLAVGVMPGVRLGVGVNLEGQILVTAGELSVTGELGADLELGWECGGATASCQSLERLTTFSKFIPKYEVINPVSGMRVELSGQFYFMAGLDAVFATVYSAGIIEAKAGPVQTVDLGFEEDQAINENYASKYDLKLEAVVEPGSGLQKVLDLISPGISLTFQTKFTQAISESPKGNVTVSKAIVGLGGGPVDITVNLANTDYFLIGYNVVRVELWQKRATESNFKRLRTFNVTASNQSVFQHTWQPTTEDIGPNEFAAFVYTQFPVPGLEVADNSIRQVDVKCFTAGPLVTPVALAAAPNSCADTWKGTASFVSSEVRVDADVTWIRDPNEPEIDGDINYIPTGTATIKWLGLEAMGCSVSRHTFDLASTANSSFLLVEFGESPPIYSGLALTGGVVTVSCPNMKPYEVPQFFLWFSGSGTLSTNGNIAGQASQGGGVFQWNFARP